MEMRSAPMSCWRILGIARCGARGTSDANKEAANGEVSFALRALSKLAPLCSIKSARVRNRQRSHSVSPQVAAHGIKLKHQIQPKDKQDHKERIMVEHGAPPQSHFTILRRGFQPSSVLQLLLGPPLPLL